ncbi:MAG: translocation/assembly module TamB domain-containing protein [Bacteroidales bacterium]|nr:translocation/assembly module TamB domain-containing protein [Bacteroidales bacterium]
MLLLIVITLPAIAYLLLQSSRIQTRVATAVTRSIAKNINTEFTIGKVDISFLYRVRLNDVFLEDVYGDTLIYAGSIIAGIRNINPFNNSVSLGSIDFNDALIRLYIDSTRTANIKYFVNQLRGQKKKDSNWNVRLSNIRINSSRFDLHSYFQKNKEYGINFRDLKISEIDADIKQFNPSADSLFFYINSLAFREVSGFKLENLTAGFSLGKTFLSFRDLKIETRSSGINANEVSLSFDRWSKFKKDSLFAGVHFYVDLESSSLNLADLGYYAPVFNNTVQNVSLTSKMTGPLNNIKGRNLSIGFGNSSKLQGQIDLNGLPEIHKTFIYADIDKFETTAEDLNSLSLPGQKSLSLPDQLHTLGMLAYSGNFTGFIDDFVAFGNLQSDLGKISTDLLFRPDTLNHVSFSGRFTADEFDLGRMIDASDKIGKISLSANVDGTTSEASPISAVMNGIIHQFEIRGYNYRNINLNGNLTNREFDGSVNINDPNIELEFLGGVDFSDSIPAYDFTADVSHANLYELNIDRSEPDFTASFYMIANARGQSVNNVNGEITLLNSLFRKQDRELRIQDFTIHTSNAADSNRVHIRSDYIDVDITGDYELDKVNESVHDFFYSYLPSLADTGFHSDTLVQNRFKLVANIKNIQPIFDMFLPEFQLAEKTTVECAYAPDNQNFSLFLHTAGFGFGNITWNDLSMSVISDSNMLNLEAGGSNLMLGDQISLDNFTVFSDAGSDTLNLEARWNNWRDLLYRGNIRGFVQISRLLNHPEPHVEVFIRPTSFYANDSLWSISAGKITVDSSNLRFENIEVSHNDQSFNLQGTVSNDPEQTLELIFNQFNLGNLKGLTKNHGYEISGILNGTASFSSLYVNPLFTSGLTIDGLAINNEVLGNSEINATWVDTEHSILLDAYTMHDNRRTIDIRGNYTLGDPSGLDFDLYLDQFRISLLNPYVEKIFSDLDGSATGHITLTGTTSQPLLNGTIDFQNTNFAVNYLRTRYNFTHQIEIADNNFLLDNILVRDARYNTANLTGSFKSNYLKDFTLDLTVRSNKLMCLNTSQNDNSTFYGTAYAEDLLLTIKGPPKNVTIDVSASTAENTVIHIPLSDERELNEYNFITIITEDEEDEPKEKISEYQVDLSGLQLNFYLGVTPDAEIQIIFDPKLGDILSAKGNGNLDMNINQGGDFMMYGDFVIEEGDYLFTLQNFINKRLTIEQGGSIRWNGDLLDATIDVLAYYRTKASLSELLGSEDDRMVVVDDRLTMTGRLMAPDVKYDIYLPTADESDRLKVRNAISSNEELVKQFISILIQNRFVLSSENRGQLLSGTSASPYTNVAGVNASEFLSNQLSHLLSQISNDVDIGINYRTNRELKSDEVQVALETQLFNDRLTINGSVDVSTNAAAIESDNIVGEFDIDYKLTSNGKLRLKTYNHVNNDIVSESTYTQGFGIFYKEEFNSLRELWKRYLQNIFGRKEDEVKVETPTSDQ